VAMTKHNAIVPDLINLKAEAPSVSRYMFEDAVTTTVVQLIGGSQRLVDFTQTRFLLLHNY